MGWNKCQVFAISQRYFNLAFSWGVAEAVVQYLEKYHLADLFEVSAEISVSC